ncbi:hypothetical protein EYF80_042676 [Liparis tanakae]|uniref:Uncharacterized protein n=1 Tax=Liparis tanakae TaxID=230148 RepID=A0A4Z2G1S5_9TELE|nr:hypothetical protein EYF80_042676 [Liparis tanakae]
MGRGETSEARKSDDGGKERREKGEKRGGSNEWRKIDREKDCGLESDARDEEEERKEERKTRVTGSDEGGDELY